MARIRVQKIATGQTGTIDESKFDPSVYKQLTGEPQSGAPVQTDVQTNVQTNAPAVLDAGVPTQTAAAQSITGAAKQQPGLLKTITGHTLEEHEVALRKAIELRNPKLVDMVKADIKEELDFQTKYGSLKPAEELKGDAKERHDNLQAALEAVSSAESDLISSGGAKGKTNLGAWAIKYLPQGIAEIFNADAAIYEHGRDDLAKIILKGVTGVNRNPDEKSVKSKINELPSITNDPDTAQKKIDSQRNTLLRQAQAFGYSDLLDKYGYPYEDDTENTTGELDPEDEMLIQQIKKRK